MAMMNRNMVSVKKKAIGESMAAICVWARKTGVSASMKAATQPDALIV